MLRKIFLIILFSFACLFAQVNENNQFMLVQAYINSAQYEKAKPIMEELYNSQPNNYEYFTSLNKVYTELKDYDASIALIESKLNQNRGDINLYGMLGTEYYLKGNDNKAFEVWDNALKTLPQNEMYYRIIANYAIERRAFDKAIQYLKEGQDISKNPVLFAYDLGNLYSLTMQFKDATDEYCMILSKNQNQLYSIENKILSYIDKPGALQASIPVVEKYAGSGEVNFKLLLARLYIQDKAFDKAFDEYKEISEAQNDQGAQLLSFAGFLYGEKNYKLAVKVYDDVLNKYPASPYISTAKLGYAKTLEATFDEENSSKIPTWKPYFALPKLSPSDIDKIVSAYLNIIKAYSHSEVSREALLWIGEIKLFKQNDISDAEKYFNEIIKDSPASQYSADAYHDLAIISVMQGNLDQAINYYLKITSFGNFAQDKKNQASYQIARLYFYKGDFEKAREYLKGLLDNLGNSSANDALELSLLMNTSQSDSSNLAAFAKAELLTDQKKFKEAEEIYKSLTNDPQKLMLQNLACLREAEMELAMNNTDSATAQLLRIADENEKNIYADNALYLLGKIYQYGLGNNAKAVETYENLLAKFPNSLYLDDARAEINKLRGISVERPM